MTTATKTYKMRGYTSRGGYARIEEVLAMQCELYNAALQERRDAYRHPSQVRLDWRDQFKEFKFVRKDDPRWDNLSLNIGRGTLKMVDRAFNGFFNRVKNGTKPGYPRFRARSRFRTIEFVDVRTANWKISDDGLSAVVKIKGLPKIRVLSARSLPEKVQMIRLTRKGRRLDVSATFGFESEPEAATDTAIGIDFGVNQLATLSDGDVLSSARIEDKRAKQLQRRISKFKKRALADGRAYWKIVRGRPRFTWRDGKAPRRYQELARIYTNRRDRERIREHNRAHRISTDLVRRAKFIFIEDLQLKNMTKSAKGTADAPGKNVAQKRGLNREILNQGLGRIIEMLSYKAEWAGAEVIKVDPRYTSRDCSYCGGRNPDGWYPKGYRLFVCKACGIPIDRDFNAAVNILRRGLAPLQVDPSDLARRKTRKTTNPVGGSACRNHPLDAGLGQLKLALSGSV